jgi:hypothetical protein
VEGYPLLVADSQSDYTGLTANLGLTIHVILKGVSSREHRWGGECVAARRVLGKAARPKPTNLDRNEFLEAFEPILRGRSTLSFENGTATISKDLAPYIRAIVAFDLRLEQYRLELSGLSSRGGSRTGRVRKTRASRAALEGGDKANTRRERWFATNTNTSRILATGGKDWQDALVQSGHVDIPPTARERRGSTHSLSESSGDGGF